MRALVVLALATGAVVGRARAAPASGRQPGEEAAPILELARAYRLGDCDRAVAVAAQWSDERITLEVRRLIAMDASREEEASPVFLLPTLDVANLDRQTSGEDAGAREATRLAAVAMLTERALIRIRDGDPELLAPRLQTADLLLERKPLAARSHAFARRFYLLAGLALHWHVEIEAGYALLSKALRHFPDDPELHTALGSMIETVASLRIYELPPGVAEVDARDSREYSSERGGHGGRLPGATLAQAQAHYQQALALDAQLDEARLRLSHVRLLRGASEAALPELERVATEARQPRQRYLAWLFAGYARQTLGDVTGAVAAYRACLAHGPRSQTAFLALGRSLDAIGDESGAQEAFASASTLAATFDPWWSYGAGQPDRFDDLVAQLRAPVE